MNKVDFLRKLNRELSVLEPQERKEILDFYEERFHTGTMYENKTEMDIIYELESPEVIARNVLEEYGVSPKYVKSQEERYTNLNTGQIVFILLFDLFVAVWLIPSLFTFTFGLFTSLLSYIGVIPMMFGERSVLDEFTFAFSTAAYVLVFLFALIMLDVSIAITRKIIVWHMNVFKIKGREKYTKRMNKVSVEGWFKKRKKANSLRTFLFVAALGVMLYSGYHLFIGGYDLFDVYAEQDQMVDVDTLDVTADITSGDAWTIETDFDVMDIDIVPVSGNEIVVTHSYYTDYDYVLTFDEVNNVIEISNDYPTVQFLTAESIFSWFRPTEAITIEVPIGLALDEIDLDVGNGGINVQDLTVTTLSITTANGSIDVYDMVLSSDTFIYTTNGTIIVKNIESGFDLTAETTNGSIIVKDCNFKEYNLESTNGGFELERLNVTLEDGVRLEADTTNGKIELEDVYVNVVILETTNGDIVYNNYINTSYDPATYERDTTNGNTSGNVN